MSDIFAAAEVGDASAIERFLAADPEAVNRAGGGPDKKWTPIMCLACSPERNERPAEFARAIKVLLDHGAEPNDEETPYHVPETYQNDVMKVLVASGKLNANSLVTLITRKHDWHDLEGIRYLLDHGADPNRISNWGRTALHQAIERDNRIAIFELLLDRGADPGVVSKRSMNAVSMAARYGRADVLDLFAARGFDVALSGFDDYLARFAHGETFELDPFLVNDIESRDPAILVEFAGAGNVEGVRRMLEAGFRMDVTSSSCGARMDTPLHSALWRGRHDVVKLLIERGAPLEKPNGHGATPLAWAVRAAVHSEWFPNRSTSEDVVALIAAGADKSAVAVPTGWAELDSLFA